MLIVKLGLVTPLLKNPCKPIHNNAIGTKITSKVDFFFLIELRDIKMNTRLNPPRRRCTKKATTGWIIIIEYSVKQGVINEKPLVFRDKQPAYIVAAFRKSEFSTKNAK